MSWVKLDDQFFVHEKVVDLPKDAKLLYIAGLAYCAAQLSDGMITPAGLRIIAAQADVDRSVANVLVAARLWEIVERGYLVHNYNRWNPSGEEEKARRDAISKARSEAGKKGMANRWHGDDSDNKITNDITKPITKRRRIHNNGHNKTITPSPFPSPLPVNYVVSDDVGVFDASDDGDVPF